LLGHHTAEGGTLREAGKFLRTEDSEGLGLDFKTMRNVYATSAVCSRQVFTLVLVLGFLKFLI
jgi:hypothetical protein